VIDANRHHPTRPIHKPGGALRAFTRLHRQGGFNLPGSLIGLLERRRAEWSD
jgi:replication initiation protein RepC